MKFEMRNRWTNEAQVTAEIECDDNASFSVKQGLAVRWAVKARANLAGANLARADLARANFRGANFAGADLARANLDSATLDGAYFAGANLAGAYLAVAYLAGADLAGANLAGANFARAYLARANLARANLAGATIKRLVTIVHRVNDPYQFAAWDTDKGLRIVAGCRDFAPEEYRAHVAANYADTPKAEETLAIIAFIEARAAAMTEERGHD